MFLAKLSHLEWLQLFIILFSVSCACADESTNKFTRPIEELFKTDVIYPEAKGEFQFELAPTFQRAAGGDTWTVPLSMEYGLTSRWQAEAEWNAFVQSNPTGGSTTCGVGDLELGTQYSFLNVGGSLFHVAPRFSIEFPLGDVNKNLSEGFIEYKPAVIVARDFPWLHDTQFFTEVAFNLVQRVKTPSDPDEREPAADGLDWNSGFFVPFSRGAISMEFNWDNNRWNNHGNENQMYLTPGLIWKLPGDVEASVGIPVGLNGDSDRFEIIIHLIVEF
jgi:hypothetical protein